jgi:hypothetical protein
MTGDPKAPGAADIYLNFEETTDDPLHYLSVDARIKILSDKAKKLATVDLTDIPGNTQIKIIKAHHPFGRNRASPPRQTGRSAHCKIGRPAGGPQRLQPAQRRSGQHPRILLADPL